MSRTDTRPAVPVGEYPSKPAAIEGSKHLVTQAHVAWDVVPHPTKSDKWSLLARGDA